MPTTATLHQQLLEVLADPSTPWRERVRFFYGAQLEVFQTFPGLERSGRQMHMEHMRGAMERGEGPAVAFLLRTRDYLRYEPHMYEGDVRLQVSLAIEGIDTLLLALEEETAGPGGNQA